MTTYAWPTTAGWTPNRFELRVQANTRAFTSPYNASTQAVDLLGERFKGTMSLPADVDPIIGGQREAFSDRLAGQVNTFQIWHFKRPVPLGTLRDGVTVNVVNGSLATLAVVNGSLATLTVVSGTPTVAAPVPQLANTVVLQSLPGRTLLAGDMFGLSSVQTVRVMTDAVAGGDGRMTVEFRPRARAAVAAYVGPVVWNKPPITVMLVDGNGIPTPWSPGMFDGASFDFIESI